MPDLLKEIPPWFLIICTAGFFSLISFTMLRLNGTLSRFQVLFDKIFEKHEEHESRISKLEGAHAVNHGVKS